jgi:hypothetical protein
LFVCFFSFSPSRLEKREREKKKGINILYVTSEIIFGIYFTSYTNNIIASSEEGALKTNTSTNHLFTRTMIRSTTHQGNNH